MNPQHEFIVVYFLEKSNRERVTMKRGSEKIENSEIDLVYIMGTCIDDIDDETRKRTANIFNRWGLYLPENFKDVVYKSLRKEQG